MKCVSYNIQFGFGLDGRYDLERIVDAVRGADLIALQEVTRNSPMNEMRDMVADIRTLLPDYFAVYGPNLEADMGSRIENGRAIDVHLQFGNMILSRWPILGSRNILLPRTRSFDRINLQRGALEAVIETPIGALRFYSTHLDHRGPDERLRQVAFLLERLLAFPMEGGALTGTVEMGFSEMPVPEGFVVMGDFNMLPGSPEHVAMVGGADHGFGIPLVASRAVDAFLHLSVEEPPTTWIDPEAVDDPARRKRLDYCFTHASLAHRLASCRVDQQAAGSDHQPVWIELA